MTLQTYQMSEHQVEQLCQVIGHQEIGDWPVKIDAQGPPLPIMEWGNIDSAGGTFDYQSNTYVIPSRNAHLIPDRDKYPRPLKMVTGEVYRHYVQVEDLRIPIGDTSSLLEDVNASLGEALRPEVVIGLRIVDPPVPTLRVSNESVLVYASRAVWDEERGQLVAATLTSTSKMSLQAILASLATNSRQTIRLHGVPGKGTISLENARRGFLSAGHKLEGGYAVTVYHPLSGDPRQNATAAHFYTVGEGKRFFNRLKTAIPWPIRDEWYEYLLEKGKQVSLIHELQVAGDFPPSYRVFTGTNGDESGWEDVISAGIVGGKLSLN